jgi:hypothetical protein
VARAGAADRTLRLYDGQVDAVSISITATDGAKSLSPSNSIDARVDVAVLNRSVDGEFPVHVVDPATQATDTMLNIVDTAFDETAIETTLQRVYAAIPGDPFDFAVLFHTRTTGDGVPRSIGVKNDAAASTSRRSITKSVYGSAGRLHSSCSLNRHTPTRINHEIGHRWAAYLNQLS